ncbi:hypothetical protein B7463_g11822, partial [Scytalidium lignicola]
MDQSSRVNSAQKIIVDLLTIREAQRTAARAIAAFATTNHPSTPPPTYQDHYNSYSIDNQQPRFEMNHPQAHLFDPHHSAQPQAQAAAPYSSYEDVDDTPPSISISITSSLSVKGSNNVVGMDTGSSAATIARSLVDAIKNTSMSAMGIPMIDEEGKPRTINVVVDAGVTVDGCDNIVGEEVAKMRLDVLRKKAGLDQKDKEKQNDEESEESEESEKSQEDSMKDEEGDEDDNKNGVDDDETEEEQENEDEEGEQEQRQEPKERNEDGDDSTTVVESAELADSSGDELASTNGKRRREITEGLNIIMNSKRPRLE